MLDYPPTPSSTDGRRSGRSSRRPAQPAVRSRGNWPADRRRGRSRRYRSGSRPTPAARFGCFVADRSKPELRGVSSYSTSRWTPPRCWPSRSSNSSAGIRRCAQGLGQTAEAQQEGGRVVEVHDRQSRDVPRLLVGVASEEPGCEAADWSDAEGWTGLLEGRGAVRSFPPSTRGRSSTDIVRTPGIDHQMRFLCEPGPCDTRRVGGTWSSQQNPRPRIPEDAGGGRASHWPSWRMRQP